MPDRHIPLSTHPAEGTKPVPGQLVIYGSSTDKMPHAVNEDGVDVPLSAAAGQRVAIQILVPPTGVGYDETTTITTGVAKCTFRLPYAMTLAAVRASLSTAASANILTIDINEGGVTILSTKLTIDATEKTSQTAAVPAVISDVQLADDAEMTIDIDVAGTGAKGLKVWLIGWRPW